MNSAQFIKDELRLLGFNISVWAIGAIRKASRMEGNRLGIYATPKEYAKWLRNHPDFVARKVFASPARNDPRPQTPPGKRGRSRKNYPPGSRAVPPAPEQFES